MQHPKLNFDEFPKSDFQDWKQSALKTLKETPPDQILKWRPDPQIQADIYYDDNTSRDSRYITSFFQRNPPSPWKLIQSIFAENNHQTNKLAKQALMHGADGITLKLSDDDDITQLLSGVQTEHCLLGFAGTGAESAGYLIKKLSPYEVIQGLRLTGEHEEVHSEHSNLKMGHISDKEFDQHSLVNNTAGIIHKIDQILNLNPTITSLRNLCIHLHLSDDFYVEITRIRSIKFLVASLANIYKIRSGPADIHIHCQPKANDNAEEGTTLLHNTTTGMAAILAGASSIDFVFPHEDPEFAHRIARNIGNLFREESGMLFDSDPIAGSTAIDHLTHLFSQATWKCFQGISVSPTKKENIPSS
ncbi:MAG: hypothetical protein KI790_03775 [Cyclobacteriaceae bacterium]|nr:hypothetical protein [Cyclobacteriaceae bacterium HetDA_MAG_MS6]